MKELGFSTKILHADRQNGTEHGAVHQPVHPAVAYGFEKVEDLMAVFQGKQKGYVYSRQGSPTGRALEEKITLAEDGLQTLTFGSGMASITAIFFALLQAGDHVVSSSFLFGNTNSLFQSFVNHGIEVDFVDATDAKNVAAALRENTRLVFVETIANPRTQVADLAAIGELCEERGIVYVVDNTLTTPWLFRPKTVKASLVVNALTKGIAGHGNALGGAVTDTGVFDWQRYPNINEAYKHFAPELWGITQIRKKGLRDTGASLASEIAHRIAVGMETLALRMSAASASAGALAEMLAAHADVKRVYYPGLPEHPQQARAKDLFRSSGSIFSFELADHIDCLAYLNRLKVAILSTNLGDTRTLAIPVAATIYFEMGAERRASMGIDDNLIRISVGIEETDDLLTDFSQAFA